MMEKEAKITRQLFLIALAGFILKYGLNIFLAHQLPADLYGDLNVAIKLLQILVIVVLFGTNVGAPRFLAKMLHSGKKANAVTYVAWNLKLISVTFLVSLSVALIAILTMYILDSLGVHGIHKYHLSVYMFWLAPFAAIVTLLSSFLLSSTEIIFPTILTNLLKYFVELSLFGIVALFFGLTLSNSLTLIGTLFFSYILLSIIAIFFIDSDTTYELKNAWSKIRTASIVNNEWFVTSSKLILNNIIYTVVCVLDLLIVEIFNQDEQSVGYYAAALTITGVMWLAPMNLYQSVKPKVSSLITSKEGIIQLQAMLDSVGRVLLFSSTVLAVLIILFSDSLLSLFGPGYEAAKIPLIILTIGSLFRGSIRFTAVLLVYSGLEDLQLKVAIIELVVLCLLGIPATYFWGITGMAVSSSAVMIVGGLFSVVVSHRKLGLRTALFI